MTELDFSAAVEAPLERVAAFFVPQRMPLWYGPEMDTEFEVSGGAADFAAGQKVRISGALGRRKISLTAVVTRYEWGRVLEWRFQDAYGVKGLQRWELARSESGGSVVHMREEFALPWRGWLPQMWERVILRRSVAARDRMYLKNLKKLVEAKPEEKK